jgi:NAD(P)-dependent dehydrogenase (short-subunit alcohol dehydrogenase family)
VAQGARVAAVDTNRGAAAQLGDGIARSGYGRPLFIGRDLTNYSEIPDIVEQARSANGPIDVLVNNAANDRRHTLDEVTPQLWDELMGVNLKQMALMSRAVAPEMRSRGRGAIINLGSGSWINGVRGTLIYEVAKAAVPGLTSSLATELGGSGIRVNMVTPTYTATEKQKIERSPVEIAAFMASQKLPVRIQPSHVAHRVMFLASPGDSPTVTGADDHVSAGRTTIK